MKISAIILADNREELITDCLKSLNWVTEKILVDLGSQDQTLAIAQQFHCRIIKGAGKYNFSLWRNQGAKAAKGDWLFYVDTDERITSALKAEVKSQVSKLKSQISGFYIPRKNFFWGKEFKTEWPDYQLRLIKKKALIGWQGKIHETPKIKGKTAYLKNPLIHLSHRNLASCLKNTLKWSWLEAENRFKAGHPAMTVVRFLRIILTGFWRQFGERKIWKEGWKGIIEGFYQIFSLLMTYVRLWQLQKRKAGKKR